MNRQLTQDRSAPRQAGAARSTRGVARPGFALAPVMAGVLCALLSPTAPAQTTAPVLPTQLKGGVVSGANAPTVNAAGDTMTISQTAQRGVIEWSNFSIGATGTVNITQPNASAVLLNRVIGNGNGSRIDGALNANGRVMILDPSGLTFGGGSKVQVGSLIGAAMDLNPTPGADPYAGFLSTGDVSLVLSGFQGAVTVENGASIRTGSGGSVVLLGPSSVRVDGSVDAPQGQVALAGAGGADIPLGTSGFVSLKLVRATGNGDQLAPPMAVVVGPTGSVTASGGEVSVEVSGSVFVPVEGTPLPPQIIHQGVIDTSDANGKGGRIALQGGDNGRVILEGDLRATGGIELVPGAGGPGGNITVDGAEIAMERGLDRLALPKLVADGTTGGGGIRVGSTNTVSLRIPTDVLLSADATDNGNGGTIAVLANFYDPTALEQLPRVTFGVGEVYGTLRARGGPKGGNGGAIETSATALATSLLDGDGIFAGSFDASVRGGAGVAGTWTLDPFDVIISNAPAVAVNGVFAPTAPGANVNASDISAALDKGTSVTISTGAPGNTGNQAGDIVVLSGTSILRSAPGGQTSLTLVADRNISFGAETSIVSTGGEVSVNLLSDRSGNGRGTVTLAPGSTIRTNGGSVLISGGFDPASGFAHNFFGGPGITMSGATIDATGAGAAGNITLRGEGTDSEGIGNGIDLVSTTLTGNDIALIGRAQSSNGVSVTNSFINSRRPGSAQGGIGVDIRGVASADFGIPTGVSFSNTLVTLDGGAMQVLGVGRGVESQPVNAIGISFDNLTVQTASTHKATITLVGEAVASGGTGMLGGANGSFNISAGEAGATGANVVIGANAGANGNALDFQGGPPSITTAGAVNLRPAGVVTSNGDQDGSIIERVDVEIAIGAVSADRGFSFSVPDTWLLSAQSRDPAGRITAGNLVLGSATQSGTIFLGTNALNSNVISNITLQNQGLGSQGIVLDPNASGPHVALMSAGPVTQNDKVVADALVLVGNGPGSDFTLDNEANLFGVLSFDGLRTLNLAKTGGLIVGGSTVSPTAGVATGFDPATGSFTSTAITTNRAADNVLLRTVGTGTTVTLGNSIVTSGANSQINIVTPDGLSVGPGASLGTGAGGRWQVWTTTWPTEGSEGLQGSGQTARLYGCSFGDTTVCSGSGAAIGPTDSGYRYLDRPTAQVSPTPTSFVQGQPVPPIAFTASGLVNGDTADGAFLGALGTTATSSSAPGAYAVLPGTLSSRQGYRLQVAGIDTLPVTVLAAGPAPEPPPPPTRFTDLTAGSGRARGFDFDRLDFETSSEVNGRNLSRSLMCMAPGALRRQTDAGEGVDALGMEWGRVRNQPHLSSCLEIGDDNQCAAF